MAELDINADIGERPEAEAALDTELLRFVSSVSVACGFHAGSATTMRLTCAAAAGAGVTIGAHPSYPDREGFGRRELDLSPERVADDVAYQVGALIGCACAAGARVGYVKPHGALYHRCHHDRELADALARAVREAAPGLTLLAAAGSALASAGESHGLPIATEAFSDRRYADDGTLVPRSAADAVLGPRAAAEQAVMIATEHRVATAGGGSYQLSARSLCVHSDSPGASEILAAVRQRLERAGITIRAFA